MQRYLLCRPQSGLNDILNQIEKCCRYAQATGRTVIVDTAYRHAANFRDAFSKYFTSRQKTLLLDNPLPDNVLDSLDVFPGFLAGRISAYRAQIGSPFWVETATGLPLTFDFRKDYRETVLVHHQGGGGLRSVNCLERLVLAPGLVKALEQRLAQMRAPYAAIHIRNTDMTTDYRPVIARLKERQLSALFLATDNRSVLEDFRAGLPATRLFSFSGLPDIGGRPLHIDTPPDDVEARNTDAILDLLTLAFGKPLLAVKPRNAAGGGYSGFTSLAAALHRNPAILQDLLRGGSPG